MRYYDNSHLCFECTGSGCKHCYDTLGLLELGTERFPVSQLINGCKPPHIQHSYGYKGSKYFQRIGVNTKHKLRRL